LEKKFFPQAVIRYGVELGAYFTNTPVDTV